MAFRFHDLFLLCPCYIFLLLQDILAEKFSHVRFQWKIFFFFFNLSRFLTGLSLWLSGKESVFDAGDSGLIPGSGRSSGEGHGNPLQYSCLENPRDRGAWQAPVPGVTKSRTRLSAWRFHLSLLLSTMPVFLFLFKYAYLFFSHTNLPASRWCLSLSLHCFQAAKKSLLPQTINIIIYFSWRVILFLIFNWIFN